MVDHGDFNLMDSSKRPKTKKKYSEIDNHFRGFRGLVVLVFWNYDFEVNGSISTLVNKNLLINYFLEIYKYYPYKIK